MHEIKKINLIISTFPLVFVLTLGIYSLISGVLICVDYKKFKNQSYALACGVMGIISFLIFIPCVVAFIMAFFIKFDNEKVSDNNEMVNDNNIVQE